jgi:hypothetical protein
VNHQQPNLKFAHFLDKFPEIEPPVTLGEETHHHFSRNNQPLSDQMIREFIFPLEEDLDELTEFVPCFKILGTKNFYAVVYWRAGLMNYQYVLVTFTEKGLLIDKRVIAGTFSDGQVLTQSVANIDEDWIISIASGQSEGASTDYNATDSTAYQLELLPDGKIVRST